MYNTLNSTREPMEGPLHLVIGVTGHCDLRKQDLGAIRAQVRDIIRGLQGQFAHTPLLFLSSLSEGGGRLAARVALEFEARLVAVLPFPRDEYLKMSKDSAADLQELLNHCQTEIVVPQATNRTSRGLSSATDIQSLLAGIYIARFSHYFIALWAGEELHDDPTGRIVHYRLTGNLPVDGELLAHLQEVPAPYGSSPDLLDPPITGPVHHVLTHIENGSNFKGNRSWRLTVPEGYESEAKHNEYVERLKGIYRKIDVFNEDALKHLPRRSADLAINRRYLFPDEKAEGLPKTLQVLRDIYGTADTLALYFQRCTYRALHLMFVLVFAAAVCFGVYAHLYEGLRNFWSILAYMYFLTLAGVVHLITKHGNHQNRFQDYRALAEGLRVQFFWRLAGLDDLVSDNYFRKQRTELYWIPSAIQACSMLVPLAQMHSMEDVIRHWIDDQFGYFESSSRRDADRLLRYVELSNGLLTASLVLATVEMLSASTSWIARSLIIIPILVAGRYLWTKINELAEENKREDTRTLRDKLRNTFVYHSSGFLCGAILGFGVPCFLERIHVDFARFHENWSVFSIGFTAVAAAFLHAYGEKRALGEHQKQYSRMKTIFGVARDRVAPLVEVGNWKDTRRILRELGTEALAEHGDWVLLHRERPVEFPKAEV